MAEPGAPQTSVVPVLILSFVSCLITGCVAWFGFGGFAHLWNLPELFPLYSSLHLTFPSTHECSRFRPPSSISFSPFQPLRACHLQVLAGSCVVFLTSSENLILQHQLPRQHVCPCGCFLDGTLYFSAGRHSGSPHSLWR